MRRIMLLNAKGGCGKTTIATNLAGYYAGQGLRTAIMDYDPQGSSLHWLDLRDENLPTVRGIAAGRRQLGVTRSWQLHAGPGTDVVIIDTPAGVSGIQLVDLVRQADTILVPVMPSVIDTQAVTEFIQNLLVTGKVRSQQKRVGVVANRVRRWTQTCADLEDFLVRMGIPIVARLRDTQNYAQAMEMGKVIHELSLQSISRDRKQWQKITEWVERDDEKPVISDRMATTRLVANQVCFEGA